MRNQVALPSQLVMLRRALDEHCTEAKIAADSPLREDIATRLIFFFQSGVSDLDKLVDRTTAWSGEPILRVTFCDEGGDRVTADMAGVDDGAIGDEWAIDRARAVPVQTATFDLALNDYDARSNGNFDEVTVTAERGGDGGSYIFEYRDGEASRGTRPIGKRPPAKYYHCTDGRHDHAPKLLMLRRIQHRTEATDLCGPIQRART